MRVGRGRAEGQNNARLQARLKAYRFRQPTADNGHYRSVVDAAQFSENQAFGTTAWLENSVFPSTE